MNGKILSINYCPVKSLSFQTLENCKIKKDIGVVGDRNFAFSKNLNPEEAQLFEKNPEERKNKWNKILTLKNSPVLNKYNFYLENSQLTLTLKESKKVLLTPNLR